MEFLDQIEYPGRLARILHVNCRRDGIARWFNDCLCIKSGIEDSVTLVPMSGDIPCARGAPSLCLYSAISTPSRRLYVLFGGGTWRSYSEEGMPHDITYFNDVCLLDSFDFTWKKLDVVGEQRPGVRGGHGAAIAGHHLIVFGGYYTTGEAWPCYDDTWVLNLQTMRWSEGPRLPLKLGDSMSVLYHNKLWTIGGMDATLRNNTNAIWTCDIEERLSW